MGVEAKRDAEKASPYITPERAARYLQLKESTLAAKRVDGTGPPFFKAGCKRRAKVLYRYIDLDEWMAKQQFTSTSEYGRKPSDK